MSEPGAQQNVAGAVEQVADQAESVAPVNPGEPAAEATRVAAEAATAVAGEQDGTDATAATTATAAADGATPAAVTQTAAAEADGAMPAATPQTATTEANTATPAAAEAAEAESGATGGGLESRAAEQLHALIERGADRVPGDQGGMVSKFAVALLSFGSAMTERGEDKKTTSALATDAVQLFKSLDDDPAKQREAMEKALSDLGSNLVGNEERGKVVDVAQQAMGLWKSSGGGIAGAAGAAAALAKSDSALSLRSLAGLLRRNGDEDGAAKSEEEARKLEER